MNSKDWKKRDDVRVQWVYLIEAKLKEEWPSIAEELAYEIQDVFDRIGQTDADAMMGTDVIPIPDNFDRVTRACEAEMLRLLVCRLCNEIQRLMADRGYLARKPEEPGATP